MFYISLVVDVKCTFNSFSSITWQELVKLEVNTDRLHYMPSSLQESFTQKLKFAENVLMMSLFLRGNRLEMG